MISGSDPDACASQTAPIQELATLFRFPNTYASKVGKTSDGMYKVRLMQYQSLWNGVADSVGVLRKC